MNVQSGVPNISVRGVWLNYKRNSSVESLKIGGMYMKNLNQYTHFSGMASGGVERSQILGTLKKSLEVQQVTLFCAEANIAIRNKDRNWLTKYGIKFDKDSINEHTLTSIFEYKQQNFSFVVQGYGDFVDKQYLASVGAQYVKNQTILKAGVSFDSEIGTLVPNILITHSLK